MEEVTYKISFAVNFEVKKRKENSGIGGYEFWGFQGYDKGEDYWDIDDINWDKSKYTDIENKFIAKYLEDNYDEIYEEILDKIN